MLGEEYILFSFEKFEDPAAVLDKVKDFKKARLIPLPPEIDAGCGFALRIRKEDIDKALEKLSKADYEGIFIMKKDPSGRRLIEKYVF